MGRSVISISVGCSLAAGKTGRKRRPGLGLRADTWVGLVSVGGSQAEVRSQVFFTDTPVSSSPPSLNGAANKQQLK